MLRSMQLTRQHAALVPPCQAIIKLVSRAHDLSGLFSTSDEEEVWMKRTMMLLYHEIAQFAGHSLLALLCHKPYDRENAGTSVTIHHP